MGGVGSGGHNRLSEEEKKRRGTFRKDRTDAAYEERAAKKVVAGPWLSVIPEPEIPLKEVGRRKYDELTRLLLEQNKLTAVSCMQAELAARMHEKIAALVQDGKYPSASDVNQLQRALSALRVAEDAQPIGKTGGKVNKFAGLGFANRPNSTVRLRPSAPAGTRK